jgi:hypothetical protein
MATTYTPEQLDGEGVYLTGKTLSSSTTYTLTITNKSIPGTCYLTLQTKFFDDLVLYFTGSTVSLTNATDYVEDGRKIGFVIEPQGTTSITFKPSVSINGDNVFINATGGIGVQASW